MSQNAGLVRAQALRPGRRRSHPRSRAPGSGTAGRPRAESRGSGREVAAQVVCPVLGEHRQLPEQVLVEAAERSCRKVAHILDRLRELLLALTDERRRLEPCVREEVADPRLGEAVAKPLLQLLRNASPPIVSRSSAPRRRESACRGRGRHAEGCPACRSRGRDTTSAAPT